MRRVSAEFAETLDGAPLRGDYERFAFHVFFFGVLSVFALRAPRPVRDQNLTLNTAL